MNTLCVILARAGSKGLRHKNLLPIAGKPMLAWTIDHAVGASSLTDIVLTTDGSELAAIGQAAGIEVIDRPTDLANDSATIDSAARHAVEQIEQQRGKRYDAVVILYGNIPVRPANLTDRALMKLRQTGCDSVQSVCDVGKMHPMWMKRVEGENNDELKMYIENTVYRRQDLPPVYMLDGGIIAVTRSSLFTVDPAQPHAFLGTDRRAIITEPNEVMDVDCQLDFYVAEALLKHRDSGITAA